MSREEAIEILSDMRAEYNLFGDEEEATRYHVLSWAIQAMTIEPVKNKLQRAVDGKTEEEMYDFLDWLMHKYANQYTDSRSAVIKWLKEDDAERKRG